MDERQKKKEYDIKYREKNKEKRKEQNKEWYVKTRKERFIEDPKTYLWSVAKVRAKQKGIVFEILPEDIFIPDKCPITGNTLVKGNGYDPNAMSLDRVVNDKGYIKGNVRVISRIANLKKSNMTLEEVEQLLKYMKGLL